MNLPIHRDSCKSRFNSVKERRCAAGGRTFCSSRNFIGSRNPVGWRRVAVESFNNVISSEDLEFLWRIGNKLMQLSLCSAVAVSWQDGRSGGISPLFRFFSFAIRRKRFCPRRPDRIFIFALALSFFYLLCKIFNCIFNILFALFKDLYLLLLSIKIIKQKVLKGFKHPNGIFLNKNEKIYVSLYVCYHQIA